MGIFATPLHAVPASYRTEADAQDAARKDAKEAEGRAEERLKKEKEDARLREEATQRDTERREAAVRAENFARTRALQLEAYNREEAVRRQADARDAAVRAQSIQLAKQNKLVDKRLELWDSIGPRVNDIYAYILRVGVWKELTPRDVLDRKREVDRTVYSYRPFFSSVWFEAFQDFEEAAFLMWQGSGQDAKIRSSAGDRPQVTDAAAFTGETGPDLIGCYRRLIDITAEQLDVQPETIR